MDGRKLAVRRDERMEGLSGLRILACSAFHYEEDEVIKVIGELTTLNGDVVREYRELHVLAYDDAGEVVGRGLTNWSAFGLRQSFEIEVDDIQGAPAAITIYPSA